MGILSRFFPNEPNFFAMFDKLSDQAIAAAIKLEQLVKDPKNNMHLVKEIYDLEDAADKIVHGGLVDLHDTFITPLDRLHIYQMLLKMDEVSDQIHAAAQRIKLMEISNLNAPTIALAGTMVETVKLLKTLVVALEKLKTPSEIQKICIEINRFENKADDEFRAALSELLNNAPDFRVFYKQKELIEFLEEVTDRVEDITHLVESIILDHA